jgi:hypothetical protein
MSTGDDKCTQCTVELAKLNCFTKDKWSREKTYFCTQCTTCSPSRTSYDSKKWAYSSTEVDGKEYSRQGTGHNPLFGSYDFNMFNRVIDPGHAQAYFAAEPENFKDFG